jgi:hypothetical protein
VSLNGSGFNAAAKPLTENCLSGFWIIRKIRQILVKFNP